MLATCIFQKERKMKTEKAIIDIDGNYCFLSRLKIKYTSELRRKLTGSQYKAKLNFPPRNIGK